MPRKLAAGNWKMNGGAPELAEIRDLLKTAGQASCVVVVCPPATLIDRMRSLIADGPIAIGGQDCHPAESGAHTGDIAAGMLADAGATYVILGHSERRENHGETDALVAAKAEQANAAGLAAIICIGETLAQRESGETLAVVDRQLSGSIPDTTVAANLVIAYEPVWAIGTGKTPTLQQIAEVHGAVRQHLSTRFGADGREIPVLYGGSVKPANAAEIFDVENVDGALVGGASLKAVDFAQIISALDAS